MRRENEPLVLDTNVVVHWLRGGAGADALRATYDLGARRPRPVIPVVVKAEISTGVVRKADPTQLCRPGLPGTPVEMMSFALQRGWGPAKMERLSTLLRELPVADISSEPVLEAYALLDDFTIRAGRRMEKNDLWIAAVARVLGAVVLTTDADFDVLHPSQVQVERLDARTLTAM